LDPIVIAVVVVGILLVVLVTFVVTRRPGRGAVRAAPPSVVVPRGLRVRLDKTRQAVAGRLSGLLGRTQLDAAFWSELEDTLVAADIGIATASSVVDHVRDAAPETGEAARLALERRLIDILSGRERGLVRTRTPSVILVVGVNGTGKTTSIAKLAAHLQEQGAAVLLGAADTFRAAAGDQLKTWASRVGVDVVGGQAGADPASVAYDALHAAKARECDVVIIDTAGRLHSKANLMDELAKVGRVLRREAGDIDEVLLVIDGTTGQNAIEQARTFTDAVGVTGIIVTKLDGTARGGMTVAVEEELDIPVKFIGVGEGMHDLVPFEPAAFVDALLGP
jgi:fused signal recognition particle receptor